MGYGQQLVCVCVCVRKEGEGLNENSSNREVFRLFIFHIVSPILQQTSMIFIRSFYRSSHFIHI